MSAVLAKVIRTRANLLRGQTSKDALARSQDSLFVGNLVGISERDAQIVGIVRSTMWKTDEPSQGNEAVEFDVELLGRLVPDGDGTIRFSRGVARLPSVGAEICELDEPAMLALLPPKSDRRIGIGKIDALRGRDFALDPDQLLRTHFAMFGATGSGKTSALVAIVRGLLDTLAHAHVVILDPHGEYKDSFGPRARVWDRSTLRLPYWLLRFRELAAIFKFTSESAFAGEIAVLREAVMEAKRRFATDGGMQKDVRLSLDAPIPYRLSDLRAVITLEMTKLKRTEPPPTYLRVLNRLDELTVDERFAFMFSAGYAHDMLKEVIGQLLPSPESAIPIAIVDLSEIPDEALDVIVACIARLLLSLANWASADGSIPSLLICEESSRYMGAEHEREGRLAVATLAQIAREGRKFGVSLGISSQRPSQLSPEVVSQCGTIFVLRTSNQYDLEFVGRALPESASALIETVPALSTGEVVAFGQAVPFPISFHVSRLPPEIAPKPKSLDFSAAWTSPGPDAVLLDRAIGRWREHGHLFHR